MATLAWPTFDQHLRLDVAVSDGRLLIKRLSTTRGDGVAGALTGQRLEEIPCLVSRLFPLCGAAHAIAALAAIESALAIDIAPGQSAYRELALLAEHGAAVGWRIAMDWPPLLDEAPAVGVCAEIRRAAAALNGAAPTGPLLHIGGGHEQLDRIKVGAEVAALARMLDALFPEAGDPALHLDELERTIERGGSVPARLISFARKHLPAAYGRHDRPMLPPKQASWFGARLAGEATFAAMPTLDGVPAEVGPLAAKRHVLVDAAAAQWGETLATRLLACALDASVTASSLYRVADRLVDCEPVAFDAAKAGNGAGVVETARGPLAYFIEAADGCARSVRSVAPTEWNFHPDGPFMAALAAAPKLSDPLRAAKMLAASFDPCVPLTINVSATERSVAAAEVDCDA